MEGSETIQREPKFEGWMLFQIDGKDFGMGAHKHPKIFTCFSLMLKKEIQHRWGSDLFKSLIGLWGWIYLCASESCLFIRCHSPKFQIIKDVAHITRMLFYFQFHPHHLKTWLIRTDEKAWNGTWQSYS